jgi:predicted nucleic acid-binding protein
MSDKIFLDTNVLVYAFDYSEPEKQTKARLILRDRSNWLNYAISTQVLQEFYQTVTHKIERAVSPDAALRAVKGFAELQVVQIDPDLIERAIELSIDQQLSMWDALIIQAAAEAGCTLLLSEDLNAGQRIKGVVVENPFVA